MASPNFDALEEQFLLILKCLPISFGDTLPPKLRLRYFNLVTEIGDFPKRIKKFQSRLSGEKYQEPDWFRRSGRVPEQSLADFRTIDDTFQAMQRSLPHKYADELLDEYRIQYYKILEQRAHLQAKSLRLEEALQRKGLL